MQMLSAFLAVSSSPTGDPVTSVLTSLEQQWNISTGQTLLMIAAGQVVVILANFIASKVLSVGENGTFLGALRVWVLHWILLIGTVLFLVVSLFALTAAGIPGIAGIVMLIVLLLFLIGLVRIPMDVYEISGARATGFVIAAIILTMVGNVAASYAMGGRPQATFEAFQRISAMTPQQRKEFFDRLKVRQRSRVLAATPLDGEDIARDASRPLPERAQALKRVYRDLETHRTSLRAGDTLAIDVYELKRARYEALLEELKAEAARNRAAGTSPSA